MTQRREKNFIVISDEFSFPYSRGLMARSLMRAGIGSDQAYEIASSVHRMLLAEGVAEIQRRKLKQRTLKMIKERYGGAMAESYEKWKLYGERIYVGDPGDREPFSRGILAQSLMAAGLSPEIAHEVSERMAADLSERAVSQISRDDLRELTYRKLYRDFGQEYSRHYLIWRRLKGPDRPLILLFSGATGTGKSSLAVEIAHRLGITRVIGTDAIREIMRGMFSSELLPSLYESSYTVWKTLKRPLGESSDPVINAFQEQAQRVNVGVRSILCRSIKENLSMILEGVHLLPEPFPEELQQQAIIIQILICCQDKEIHRNRFVSRGQEVENRSPSKYLENFESIRRIQDVLLEKAGENGVFIIDNIDFDETVNNIIHILTNRMGSLVEIDFSAYEKPLEEARL
ncbi:MAG TPA: ATP cone domain-containing protein [Candidatus Glassbacteria bacterium]|nr:ATP cone domain-containing protein [Candidatus Glassbacteria bacterium]